MQKIGKTGKTVLVSIIAAVVLLLSAVLPVLLLQGPQKARGDAAVAAGGSFTVSVEDNSDSAYLGPGLTSYGSAYPAAKSQVIIQISTLSGSLVVVKKISFATQAGQSFDLGGSLTANTQYRVRIITPTYLRYSVIHYIDVNNDEYNNLATNTFIIKHTGSQGVVVSVDLLQDDSWLTYFS